MSDITADMMDALVKCTVDLYKECYEYEGIDLGETKTIAEYHNYLIEHPLVFKVPGSGFGLGDFLPGFDNITTNMISYMVSFEGWYDHRAANGYGNPAHDNGGAVAGHSSIDPNGVITVGPGLTHYLNGNSWMKKSITDGTYFTLDEIAYIYIQHVTHAAKDILGKNPQVKEWGQNVLDACIDLYHSGPKWIKPIANARSVSDIAKICGDGPVTANGKKLTGLVERRASDYALVMGERSTGNKDVDRHLDAYYKFIHPYAQPLIEAIKRLTK